jgi:hypothetical protein
MVAPGANGPIAEQSANTEKREWNIPIAEQMLRRARMPKRAVNAKRSGNVAERNRGNQKFDTGTDSTHR